MSGTREIRLGIRHCERPECQRRIPYPRAKNPRVKYCSDACANAVAQARHRARKKAEQQFGKLKDRPLPTRARRGETYDRLLEDPDLLEKYHAGIYTAAQIALHLGVDRSSVDAAISAIQLDMDKAERVDAWEGPPDEALEALDDFEAFRNRYFLTRDGIPYATEPYHRKWIDALLRCMEEGGRQMILSPPRHGKTQLLLHFCVWQLVKDPHKQIVWVAGNKDLAKDWIASIELEFEDNELLIQDFLPPGGSFRPPAKSRLSWAREQFSLSTHKHILKSPNMVAVSRGSKILSRDVDLIICDDIEDHQSTIQPSNRENTRKWWATDVLSRKENHTGWFVIGSRQHPDDLYGHLLESPAWESIVETAHDITKCRAPESLENKDHIDCMLWPSRHSYSWLMDQLAASETTGGRAMWEMVYLNRPFVEGLMIFSRDHLLQSRNFKRDLFEFPEGTQLVAGLDPSATGYQASFLWGYHAQTRKLLMVDLENEEGGGIPKARNQISWWFDQHPEVKLYCRLWYIEDNLYRGAIRQDEVLTQYARDNMIVLEPHHTSPHNKWDQQMGVTAMPAWWEAELVDLPYGTPRAKAKTDAYIRQLLNFQRTVKGRGRHANGDIVMASWFPFPHLKYLDDNRTHDMDVGYAPSYGSLTTSTMFTFRRSGGD